MFLGVFGTVGNMSKTREKSDQIYLRWGLYVLVGVRMRVGKRSFRPPSPQLSLIVAQTFDLFVTSYKPVT